MDHRAGRRSPDFFIFDKVAYSGGSGINAKNISLLENVRIDIGKRRAEKLAQVFKVHPAIIMFPEYEAALIQKAA